MRGAALIFGLLAGVFGGAVLVFGNLERGLVAHPSFAGNGGLIAAFILYLIPLIGLLGGGLALVRPKLGSMFMLLSAVAWLAVAWIAGHGAILFAALPFTFVAAGGIVALTARRHEASRDLALVPQSRRGWPDEDEEAEEDTDDAPPLRQPPRQPRMPASRAPQGRSEPDFGQLTRRQAAPPVQHYPDDEPEPEDTLPLEPEERDFIDAEEAVEDEGAEPFEAEGFPEDEPVAEEEPQIEDEVGEVPPVAPQPPRARQGNWSLPDPEHSPAPRRTQQRYIPQDQRAPSRRQPLPRQPMPAPAPSEPEEDALDLSDEDFAPPRRAFEPRPRNAYRDFNPYDPEQREDRSRSPLGGLLRMLVLLLFVLVVGGIAAAVYFDYERGPNSILFGTRQPAATTGAPAAALSSNNPAPSIAPPASQTAAATPAAAPSAAASPAPVAAVAPATAAPSPAAAPPPALATAAASTDTTPTYADPFAYCRAVGTVDVPDSTYSGPPTPDAVLRALGLAGPSDQAHWRCSGNQVLACNANHGSACDLTPTVDMMISYCAQHPDAKNLPAPNGSWNCNGKRPSIPRDQKWPVDARGFFPDAWKQVLPSGQG